MSNDRMTAEEIRRNYRQAKNKKKQLLILAELNLCKPADIRAIINGETDELPSRKTKSYSFISEEDKQEILRLYQTGLSRNAIANKTGRGWDAVNKIITEAEMTFTEEQTPQQNEQLLQEITEKIADKPLPEEPASVGVVEIAGALLDFVANDLRGYIVEIKYGKEGYTVRVEGESEGVVLTRRHGR